MRACAFFSPSLHPVLHGGEGDEDAVVSPQVPTCRAVGQAILDHDPHGQVNHPVGVLTAGWREIRQVSVEVFMAFRTGVLRIHDDEIPRTPQVEIPEVVQRSLERLIPIGLVTTTRTGLARVGATGKDNLWRRQVYNGCHPFGGIGSIRSRTAHGCVLRARMLGPALYDKYPSGAIPKPETKPGKDAIVSVKKDITYFPLRRMPPRLWSKTQQEPTETPSFFDLAKYRVVYLYPA